MTITERSISDIVLLDIDGRIAVQDGALQFGTRLRHALHLGRVNMVLNLSGVPDIDNTALGELVRAFATAAQMGGGVKLLHVKRPVRDLLLAAKLLPTLEVFDDEGDALASFATA